LHGLPLMPAARLLTDKFDPADAIAVITGYRKQRFPLERELAFSGFITWMLFPTRPDFVSTALVVGAANYFLNSRQAKRNAIFRDNPYFSQEILARTLLSFPFGDALRMEFQAASNEIDNIFEIINFFMICPGERRPSLLKALYFIDAGGFISEEVDKQERKNHKRSPATLKKSWVNNILTGPFIWAAISLEREHVLRMSPDQPSTIRGLKKLLARNDDILDFFGAAKFCQDRLWTRLDARSKSRFRFIEFPPNVVACEMELVDFDAIQMAILQDYRAPK
jgi:hypothetical protein